MLETNVAKPVGPVDSSSTEDEIDAFHESVRAKLLNAEASMVSEARDMQHEAARLMADARRIRSEAQASRWYNLSGTLNDAEIESLCEIDPMRLLDDDREG